MGSRAWRIDLAAALLLMAGAAAALAVLTHDQERPHPLLGRVATELSGSLGVAVYVFFGAWLVGVLGLFLRKRWLRWSLRFLGWLLLVPAAAVLAHRYSKPISAATGGGGEIGALLHVLLEELPATWRGVILYTALGVGVVLAFGPFLRWLLGCCRGGSRAKGSRHRNRSPSSCRPRRPRPRGCGRRTASPSPTTG
jgi:hypothetical protein